MHQWRFGDARDELLWRDHAGFRCDPGLEELRLCVSRFQFWDV